MGNKNHLVVNRIKPCPEWTHWETDPQTDLLVRLPPPVLPHPLLSFWQPQSPAVRPEAGGWGGSEGLKPPV